MGVFSKQTPDGLDRKPAWHSDLKDERRELFKTTGKVGQRLCLSYSNQLKESNLLSQCFLIVVVILYAVQSLYFGALFRQPENTYRLTVRVIDLDSQYAQQNPDAPGQFDEMSLCATAD